MSSLLNSLFPFAKDRNILIFYLLTILNSSWFIAGNWIFFWTRFLTYGQLGIVDATAFAFGLLMEIPTGALADLLGKKKTLLVSSILCFLGVTFLIAPTNSMWTLLFGFMTAQVGWAFYSGSAEAMAYDSLKENNNEKGFEKVITRSNMIGIFVTIITTLIGGLMYMYWFRLPHYAWGAVYFFAALMCLFLREPSIDSEKFSLKVYIS